MLWIISIIELRMSVTVLRMIELWIHNYIQLQLYTSQITLQRRAGSGCLTALAARYGRVQPPPTRRRADAGCAGSRHGVVAGSRCWLASLACRCRPGAGSTGCAGLNASRGVTTGCQRRPASGCADVDRDWDDRAVYGGEHALPADVTIGIADPGLSEWRKVTCNVFSGFPTNFGSLSHQLSLRCRKPSLTCTAQLAGIGGSSFLSRKMRLSISFHLCLHFTQVSQIKALRSKLRFHVLIKILASFEFRALIQYKDVILLV